MPDAPLSLDFVGLFSARRRGDGGAPMHSNTGLFELICCVLLEESLLASAPTDLLVANN